MEKINIAELLEDCPKGMALYTPIFGEVYLYTIRPHLAIVVTTDKEQGDFKEEFLYDGRYGMKGECLLFPSKGKTTWEGFVPPCKFKVGDKIREKGDEAAAFTISDMDDSCYYCGEYVICNICDQDDYELVPKKFDINNLKPFDKVLVRDTGYSMWIATLFSHLRGMTFYTAGGWYNQCIPYEGNEHLLGKTDDCDEYYKTWE